jgi:hypothetical protein
LKKNRHNQVLQQTLTPALTNISFTLPATSTFFKTSDYLLGH